MKRLTIILAFALPFLFSCSNDNTDIIDGEMTSGAVEIEMNGEYITVHHETITMQANQDEMVIEFRSKMGVYNGIYDFQIITSSENIKSELIDPLEYDGHSNSQIPGKDFIYQKVKISAPGQTAQQRNIKFRLVTHEYDGKYSDFTVIKPGKE